MTQHSTETEVAPKFTAAQIGKLKLAVDMMAIVAVAIREVKDEADPKADEIGQALWEITIAAERAQSDLSTLVAALKAEAGKARK